jgi:hypothetical protein
MPMPIIGLAQMKKWFPLLVFMITTIFLSEWWSMPHLCALLLLGCAEAGKVQ